METGAEIGDVPAYRQDDTLDIDRRGCNASARGTTKPISRLREITRHEEVVSRQSCYPQNLKSLPLTLDFENPQPPNNVAPLRFRYLRVTNGHVGSQTLL